MADGFEQGTDCGIVTFDALFKVGKLAGEFLMEGQRFAEPDKRAHDGDVDLNRCFAAQDAGEHGHPLFSKGVRQVFEMLAAL